MRTPKSLILILLLQTTAACSEESALSNPLSLLNDESFLEDPENIMAWVELPRRTQVGQDLVLTVTIENGRDDETFKLTSIDLGDRYLDGFEVVGYDPQPADTTHAFGFLEMQYPAVIAAGEQQTFTVRLKATTPGVHIGDLDVYEDSQFLTRALQTRIVE